MYTLLTNITYPKELTVFLLEYSNFKNQFEILFANFCMHAKSQ